MAFSKDGKLLGAANAGGSVVLIRTGDWKIARRFEHDGGATSLAFDSDGRRLFTAGYDGNVRVWDIATGGERGRFAAAQGPIWSIDLSPDGKRLATSGEDSLVRLWPLDGSTTGPKTLRGHQRNVWEVRYSPDGQHLASGSFDQTARIWTESGNLVSVLRGHSQAIVGLDYSPDGRTLATGADDSTIRLWQRDGSAVRSIDAGDHVYQLDFSPDGAWLASGGRARGGIGALWHGLTGMSGRTTPVRLWRVSDGALVASLPHPADVPGIAFSPDGRLLATSDEDGGVRIWRVDRRRR